MPDVLRLEVTEYTDPARWRWRLTSTNGAFLADHEVRLDPADWQSEAFGDLRHYVSWHAADETYAADESRIVTEVGDWVGKRVFGGGIMAALARNRNATVRVVLPAGAGALAFVPLELARANGQTLAALGITLVIETGDAPARPPDPVGERLRVLGLFSLPEQSSPLNLRRERHELVSLIRSIAASGRAADVKVLQYGVTRDRLRDVLTEAEGWDIVHVSGHGNLGEILLETAAGGPDRITAGELAGLLDTARDRVKLVTVAACWSAARTASDQRRRLQLPVPEDQTRPSPERIAATAPSPGALATELTSRLGCAVLAMRYPVDDDFAIEFFARLYALLADKGQPLPRALAMTQQHLANGTGRTNRADHKDTADKDTDRNDGADKRRYPALSLAAPAVFGATATGLVLRAPDRAGPTSYATGNLKMASFPPPPERLVGRTSVTARASAALAAQSGVPGVLLHGMPGGGKTACALELAYGHEDAFDRLVWFKAPDEGSDICGALTDFALALERDLPGFQMIHVLADESKLDAFLPRLTELMERSRVLIVIDNAESLLTDGGQWRDERWGKVFGALTGHTGYGKVIATSRRVPATAHSASAETRPGPGMLAEAVDALSLDEALLLARELPSLQKLIYGELSGIDRGTARKLARGVLNVAQGHPKLLELADGQAADPERLGALVQAGDQTWQHQGGLPDVFFTTGETTADPADYLQVLAAWTKSVTGTLAPSERDLFSFLCCLEESDRTRPVLDSTWVALWRRLYGNGPLPGLDHALAAIITCGLATLRDATVDGEGSYLVSVSPVIAAAGRAQSKDTFRTAVYSELAAYWASVADDARAQGPGASSRGLAARANLAADPYLKRLGESGAAGYAQDTAYHAAGPHAVDVQVIADSRPAAETGTGSNVSQLLTILENADPNEAEREARALITTAVSTGDYRSASAASGILTNLLVDTGRLAEALSNADKKLEYSKLARLSPWDQLGDEAERLRVLNALGLPDIVKVRVLIARMETLPVPSDRGTSPKIREELLETGRVAAVALGRWDDALEFAAAVTASRQERSASAIETARARFNEYLPLIKLDRWNDALQLLLDCRHTFSDADDIPGLGSTLSALARIENLRSHDEAAVLLEQDALRYRYLTQDPSAMAASHHALGDYLHRHSRQRETAVAHHLAAALIRTLANDGGIDRAVADAASDLREAGTDVHLPGSVAALCDQVSMLPGVDMGSVLYALSPEPGVIERAFTELVTLVRERLGEGARLRSSDGAVDRVMYSSRVSQRNEIRMLVELAESADQAGRLEESAGYLASAVAILRTGTDLNAQADTLARYAAEQLACGKPEQALVAYEESAALSRHLRDRVREFWALNGLVTIYRTLDLRDDLKAAERRAASLRPDPLRRPG